MRQGIGTFVAVAALTVAAGMAAAEPFSPEAILRSGAEVVILGEIHDNPAHHANQAAAVAAMQPTAIVFEMLTPEQAAWVTPENRGDAAALGEALGWDGSGWPDFAMYHPIFTAAPGAAILGGALPREEVRRAMTEGAAAILPDAAARFGLDQPLPEAEQAEREADQMRAHCDALPAGMLPGMVEAQRLRDAAMARAVLAALEGHGAPVALIAGSGHARTDWGVPAMLARAAPDLRVLSIGQTETGGGTAEPEGGAPYDLTVTTAPAERGDPCEAFR